MELKQKVQEKYGAAARRVLEEKGLPADCCATTSCCDGAAAASCDPITSNLYDEAQAGQIPEQALKASLGCGTSALAPPRISGRYTNLPCQTEINWPRQAGGGQMLKP